MPPHLLDLVEFVLEVINYIKMCNAQNRLYLAISLTISENIGTKVKFFRVIETSQKIKPLKKITCDSLVIYIRVITQNGHHIAKEGSPFMVLLIWS